jgi:polyribonucleotide nucleotidyltransferase
MSWLSKTVKKAGDWVTAPGKAINNNIYKPAEKAISNAIPHVHSAEKRAAMEATKAQIDYYNQAKNDAAELKKSNEAAKNEERKKINEKEIRARQRIYRRQGFMSEPSAGPSEKLG